MWKSIRIRKTVRVRLHLPVGCRVCVWNGGGQAHKNVYGRIVEVNMTRKEELFSDYESVKDKAVCVTLVGRGLVDG